MRLRYTCTITHACMSAYYSTFADYINSFSAETEIEHKVRYSNSPETRNLTSFGAKVETEFQTTFTYKRTLHLYHLFILHMCTVSSILVNKPKLYCY